MLKRKKKKKSAELSIPFSLWRVFVLVSKRILEILIYGIAQLLLPLGPDARSLHILSSHTLSTDRLSENVNYSKKVMEQIRSP